MPDLALRLTFPADLKLGPETYTYTAKRYTFTYTMMRRVRVRVRRVADPSDPSDPSDSWSKSRIPVLDGALPSCRAQTSMPSVASTATVPGFSCPNPIPRPFDTETDSEARSCIAIDLFERQTVRFSLPPTPLPGSWRGY
ncbi:MAG: hypothetical protein ACOX52_16530 [Verrucomicrobiota bacterium]